MVRNLSSFDSCVRSPQWMATSMCSAGCLESNCCPCESGYDEAVLSLAYHGCVRIE